MVAIEEQLHRDAAAVAGGASVRPAVDADAIDGVLPRVVVEPGTAAELAACLAWASRERHAVVVRGGGTKLGWGRTPDRVDVSIGTRRLAGVLAYSPGDLTATFQAGTTLEDVQQTLGAHQQWLAIESASDGATVGGALATNDSGPLRHRHGTPRDLVIGVTLALADGQLVKAGGNVVKNVAGYDLGRLVTGSFGSLAAIVSATFKLSPLTASSATFVATLTDRDAVARLVNLVGASQLEPSAFDICASAGPGLQYRVFVQFASVAAAVDAQLAAIATFPGPTATDVVRGDAERMLWREQHRRVWRGSGTVLRLSWLPAGLAPVLSLAERIGHSGASVELVGRAGIGSGFIQIDGAQEVESAALAMLRRSTDCGHVVVLRMDPSRKATTDVWGRLGDTESIAQAVKQSLDPAGVLNAGRGPI